MFQMSKLVYECFMIMLMLCKSSYARLTPEVLQSPPKVPQATVEEDEVMEIERAAPKPQSV